MNDNSYGPTLGFLITLILVGLYIAYYLNNKLLDNIAGKWEHIELDGSTRYEINISVDRQNSRFQVVGTFPYKSTPFLSRGVYPFIYKVNLYPIMDPVSDFVLKFIPYMSIDPDDETEAEKMEREEDGEPQEKFYHLTLERTVRTEYDIPYKYRRISQPKSESNH